MTYKRIKLLFYSYAFFDGFILIYPLYAIMFAEAGLTAAQISSLFVAWSITSFLLEVPTGAIADKFPRKYVLAVALLFKVAAFASWLLMPGYAGFLAGFVLWGIETALVSGTKEALVYDELKRYGKTNDYALVTGRIESLDIVATIAAGIGAALLAVHGYGLILVLSIVAVCMAGVCVILLPKAKAFESTEETRYLEYIRLGLQVALRNPKVLLVTLLGAFTAGVMASDEYFSLFLQERGFSVAEVAFWGGAVYAFGIVGSSLAYRLEKKPLSLPLLTGLWALILAVTTVSHGVVIPLAIGLFIGLYYMLKVLLNNYLQQHISDKTRATTTSVSGLLAEVFALLTVGIFALTADAWSYGFSLQIVAATVGVVAVICMTFARKRKVFLKTNKEK